MSQSKLPGWCPGGPLLPRPRAGLRLRQPAVIVADNIHQQTLLTPYSWFLTHVCPPSPILGSVTSLSVTTEQMSDNPITQRAQTVSCANLHSSLFSLATYLTARSPFLLFFCRVGQNPKCPL